jgi:ATP-dependent 26S proteasome regulatory subunit
MARIALTGRRQDVLLYARRLIRQYKNDSPPLSNKLVELLRENPSSSSPVRSVEAPPAPVDLDSRMNLIRIEDPVVIDFPIVWAPTVKKNLHELILERELQNKLLTEGLHPSRTALLTGPPGVGKTLAARFLARELGCPLLLLDLATVMSSYLGRTGNNLRQVLDYAKSVECVILIDEFDAIAKRRDDPADVGELKRLVNVLLQEVDDWPHTGLLLAATNHPDLLDPAIWRRFDAIVDFPLPEFEQREELFRLLLGNEGLGKKTNWESVMASLFNKASFDRISKVVTEARRRAVILDSSLEDQLMETVSREVQYLPTSGKKKVALGLLSVGLSQRNVSVLTGLSRDTIRKTQNPSSDARRNSDD